MAQVAAIVRVLFLAWELLYTTGMAKEKRKKKEKRKRKARTKRGRT